MDTEAILEDCKKGDSDAFGVLYRTYSLPMLGVIGYYIHDRDVAKDILHDGFIVAFTSISSLKDGAKVESWLTAIMKNLSLQYLRKEAEHVSISMSDAVIPLEMEEQKEDVDLSWEQLLSIINRLPDGYNKVFRLNVLDGLSHKEIAQLLGISHLTSASQLHHAKVLLRRMINEYRTEIGVFVILMILSVGMYDLFFRSPLQNYIGSSSVSIITFKENNAGSAVNKMDPTDQQLSDKHLQVANLHQRTNNDNTEVMVDTVSDNTQIVSHPRDSVMVDSAETMIIPVVSEPLIAKNENKVSVSSNKKSGWTLSLAYSGTEGDGYTARNNTNIGSEHPDGDSEETKRVRHHMPFTIGITFSRSMTERLGVESGVRYTYLRTDQIIENRVGLAESIQRINYVGIPLKLNYRVLDANRFSLYGQGGVVLDIPLQNTITKKEIIEYEPAPTTSETRLHAPVQWSVEGGIGVQYHLTPSISVYAEPSFKYFFNSGEEIYTIRQEKPLELTIPIGVKLTF